jgi:hypothetical protein
MVFVRTFFFCGGTCTLPVRDLSAARAAANTSPVAPCWVPHADDPGVAAAIVLSSLSTVSTTVSRPRVRAALAHISSPAPPVGAAAIIGWFSRATLSHDNSLPAPLASLSSRPPPTPSSSQLLAYVGDPSLCRMVPYPSSCCFLRRFPLKVQKARRLVLSLSHQQYRDSCTLQEVSPNLTSADFSKPDEQNLNILLFRGGQPLLLLEDFLARGNDTKLILANHSPAGLSTSIKLAAAV